MLNISSFHKGLLLDMAGEKQKLGLPWAARKAQTRIAERQQAFCLF